MSMSIESIKNGAGKALVPVKVLSEAFIGNAEKIVALQMDSRKVYSDIAFGQLKKMSTITSAEAAGDFFWGQIEPIGAFNKQLLADWKSMMALNSEFASDLKSAFTTNQEAPKKKTAPKKKAASAKSTSEPVTSVIAAEPKPATKASKPKPKSTAATKKLSPEKILPE